jgi:hypothetical protein
MNERIDFYCAEPSHLTTDLVDRLTMHEERWAYCASGAAGTHRWQSTGGMTLSMLKRRLSEAQHST